MRCFISIDLPSKIKEEITKIEEKVQNLNEMSKLKIVKPENLHITLKFLGELTDNQINKIKQTLKGIKFESFKVKLNSVGVFPSLNYIRVLWVDVLPKKELIELQKKIDIILGEQGFRKNKNFETHITFARVKFIKNEEKARFIKEIKEIKVEPFEFEIKDFSLKKSTLTKEGPLYEDILRFKFQYQH